jgi:hypothetical protein
MVSAIAESKRDGERLGFDVEFLYSSKLLDPVLGEGVTASESVNEVGKGLKKKKILFLSRLQSIARSLNDEMELRLFLTSGHPNSLESRQGAEELIEGFKQGRNSHVTMRRINEQDILNALGPVEARGQTVCYICGVPGMTDESVEKVLRAEGMVRGNILCEKWW